MGRLMYQPDNPYVAHLRKVAQFSTAFLLLRAVERSFGFKTAVLVGLALNSADLNEAREKAADILSLTS